MDSSNYSGFSIKTAKVTSDLASGMMAHIQRFAKNRSYEASLIFFIFLVLFCSLLFSCIKKEKNQITPVELRCEYSVNPLGVESKNPRLSWILQSDLRNQKQTAYHILVASSLEKLNNNTGDIWNSSKVKSEQSVQNHFQGKTPGSGKRYYWKVRVWDKNNNKSNWSIPSWWEMGLLSPDDWKADWITYESTSAPHFRKVFEITKEVKEARVYISGLGYYELSINGEKVGDHVLDPGQTDYEQRTFYIVYDITESLKQGTNAVGVILGNGWYNQNAVNHGKYGWNDVVYGIPRLIFQMHLTFTDGSQDVIISDNTWKASSGPIISDNIYVGEHYDARLEQDGWNTSGFDDTNWKPVKPIEGPGGKLVCQNIPPIKKMQSITPVSILNPKPGVYVYDMGQNFSGWAKLKLKADKGTEIQLRFAEWLNNNGMIDPGSTGFYATDVIQTDKYICKGGEVEIWEPRFTYHGFQYIEMTGFPGTPSKENLVGIVVHTSLEKSGEFECSDTMMNKLHKTALWTEISNLHSIPTDCPHRERCGWLGDVFLTSDMTIYNFDAARFWSKFTRDIETSRRGDVPTNIAPGKRMGGKDPDWGAAFIQLPWNMYLYYGDKTIITDHYEGMTYFMDYLQKIAEDYIIYKGIGSLFSPGRIMPLETPREFTTTLMFYFCADVMARMSGITGKPDDASKYSSLTQKIKSAFNNKFYDKSGRSYGGQEKNTLALAFGLVPEGEENTVAENLNRYVMETHNGHVSTGVFGSRYIYWALGKYGYGQTVKQILNAKTFPSYGYLFSRGATTFWENWGELKFEDRKASGDDRSKSHPFQGGFDAWFYNGIAGINPDPENPGFKHIIFQPQLINSLDWASAKYNSIHGMITSRWENTAEGLRWEITVPVNTTATVYIPTVSQDSVMEGNILASKSEGVKFLRTEKDNCLYEIGSGNYTFNINRKK